MPAAAPEPVAGDYRHRVNVWLSPRVLPWIAVGALVIVFILMFFPWVGYYPGGVGVATQNAWQAAFGSCSFDPDLEKMPPLSISNEKGKEDRIQPGASVLLIFFVLIFLLALVAVLGAAALGILPGPLPPRVEQLRPWRWAIVSGITLLAFLLFAFQLVGGFNLANALRDRVEKQGAANVNAATTATEKKEMEVKTALHASAVRTTCSLRTSFWLMLLAVVCAALTYSLSRRTSRPLPRMELLW